VGNQWFNVFSIVLASKIVAKNHLGDDFIVLGSRNNRLRGRCERDVFRDWVDPMKTEILKGGGVRETCDVTKS
jgi:hypothetical protein